MKKILAILLAITMLSAATALASNDLVFASGDDAETELDPNIQPYSDTLPEPGTVFNSYAGYITEVNPYYDTNEKIVEGRYFVNIETEEIGTVTFYIDEESVDMTGKAPEKGDSFIGFFDVSMPVLMIYPPRYTAVSYAVNLDKVEYIVEGKQIEASTPFLKDFTVMVPVRAISEALGYKAEWVREDGSAVIGDDIRFSLSSDGYTVGESAPIELGIAPIIVNNRAFVPLSFFREVINMNNAYYFEGQIVINNDEKME